MLTVAFRAPPATGLNVTRTEHVAPGARPAAPVGQLLFAVKSAAFAPVRPMLVIENATLPELERVTLWLPLVVFTSWSGNVKVPGVKLATDCVPTPLSEMFNAGRTGSVLLMTRTELRLPMAVGLKVMDTVQVAP
jgi:hypothetical protein